MAADTKLSILFYIGIILPTTITIGVFIGFLVCWFRCNLGSRLLEFRNRKKNKASNNSEQNGETVENADKASQHSADSAIDVNELELTAFDDREKYSTAPRSVQRSVSPAAHPHSYTNRATPHTTRYFLTEADIHNTISRGIYPSHEKLNDEIHSEPRIYETPEDLEIAMYNGLAPSFNQPNSLTQTIAAKGGGNPTNPTQKRHDIYAPKLVTARRTSYGGSEGIKDNHITDYGFAPWQRPNSVCSTRTARETRFSLPKHMYNDSNISWHKGVIEENTTDYQMEILHV